ncbi:hypothetical protein UlMin_009236 [Ulmus minor]
MRAKLALILLLSSLFLASTLASTHHYSERELREALENCQEACEWQARWHGDRYQQELQKCQRRCEDEIDEYRHCQSRCDEEEKREEEKRRCLSKCQLEEGESVEGWNWRSESGETQRNNPYYFHSQRFQSRFKTQEGNLRVLEKFAQRSELLRGVENYRLAVLEAAPNTFVAPHHCDAETVCVCTKGRGTISILRQNNKESHNIERGDVLRIRAGSTIYLINQDNNEQLQIVKLLNPVNVPDQFQEFFPAGGEKPQSYLRAFSSEILERALSVSREQLDRLIGEKRQEQWQGERQQSGFIKRASQEQLRALSQEATSPRRRGGREAPICLQNQRPLYSNNFGKLYEVNPERNQQLKDIDVLVNWVDIKQGAMMVPHFNSRATVLAMVVEGNGQFEMACPHLARQSQEREQREEQEQEQSSGQYHRVTARLSPGDVVIIPAGHPIAIVANENLRMVGFGINAENNEKNFVAGRDNMLRQLEKEAKELAFNMPGQEVEQILNQSKLSCFVPVESQQEGRGRTSHPLVNSILDLAGFV